MKVELIDVMGDDLRVANAARVSFAKESDWDVVPVGTNGKHGNDLVLSEKDQKLIRYLATHQHWTPFSHVVISLRETVPIFIARERYRHTVGFTYNEESRRYIDTPPEFFTPSAWRTRAANKKQGSSDEVFEGNLKTELDHVYAEFCEVAKGLYLDYLQKGLAPEQARMFLPQSMYTSYYCTGSLAAFARAYKLRSAPDAQLEIQWLAEQWNDIIRGRPELQYSWEALTN